MRVATACSTWYAACAASSRWISLPLPTIAHSAWITLLVVKTRNNSATGGCRLPNWDKMRDRNLSSIAVFCRE